MPPSTPAKDPLPDDVVDLLVLGSGCAALTAALHAADAGLQVTVCEKTNRLGGTSAMSAGGIWVAGNHLAAAAGIADDLDAAFDYVKAVAPAGFDYPDHWRAILQAGPRMLLMLEDKTPLRFRLTGEPDPYMDISGARAQGRMLSVLPISRLRAGRDALRVRGSTLPEVFTYHEVLETDLYHKPIATTLHLLPRLLQRVLTLSAGKGTGLMVGMVAGCKKAGVTLHTRTAAEELIVKDGRVIGAWVRRNGRRIAIHARRGTLIATGGFEWNAQMLSEFFPGPVQFLGSSAGNTGDGHQMAAAVGAVLDHMDQANVTAAIPRRYEGAIHGMPVPYHAEENAIVVNRHGQRFWDELQVNLGEALVQRDARTNQPIELPAFVITDARYLKKLPLVQFFARNVPGWMVKAPTLAALAAKIGIDAEALQQTVARYNQFAQTGLDADFGRGKTRAHQKADKRKRAGLEAITKAPFIAIKFNPSIMTTKGGPRTDARGRALRADGSVIAGLYCAGAAMANPIGTRGVGAGTTLGPFMAWGYVCAEDIIKG
ncbi:FAD-dependent oxidoreductase [Ketogulonicigenium vulgare]|uniref:FAD-dependent oxidoreductase n=1 Tax=Ketogulonicigenium vulgare TaxID=92945 RepID=UPI00235A3814|nr:FAD-dependent oxidoreductase [Ketogulonicigenium vulgare]